MDFNSLDELYKYVEKAHEDVSCNDVQESIKEVESDVIDKEVYSKYKPSIYKRRKKEGGLSDAKNMKTHIRKNGNNIEVEITNETPLNPPNDGVSRNYRLDQAVEYGRDYYEYPMYNRDEKNYAYLKPRSFTKKTEERLSVTKEHEKAYKNTMKSKGIDVD
ncbi:hypothetical protein ACXAT3_002707 [Clostridium sporogenes]